MPKTKKQPIKHTVTVTPEIQELRDKISPLSKQASDDLKKIKDIKKELREKQKQHESSYREQNKEIGSLEKSRKKSLGQVTRLRTKLTDLELADHPTRLKNVARFQKQLNWIEKRYPKGSVVFFRSLGDKVTKRRAGHRHAARASTLSELLCGCRKIHRVCEDHASWWSRDEICPNLNGDLRSLTENTMLMVVGHGLRTERCSVDSKNFGYWPDGEKLISPQTDARYLKVMLPNNAGTAWVNVKDVESVDDQRKLLEKKAEIISAELEEIQKRIKSLSK